MQNLPLIICPKCSELLLKKPACPKCGWQRPQPPSRPGQEVWSSRLKTPIGDQVVRPAVMDGVAVFPTAEGALEALDVSCGAWRWRCVLPQGHRAYGVQASPHGLVVTSSPQSIGGSQGGMLQLLDPSNGKQIWSPEIDSRTLSNPAVGGGYCCFYTADRHLHLVDLERRKTVWKRRLPEQVGWTQSEPLMMDKLIVLPGGAGLKDRAMVAALDYDGNLSWSPDFPEGSLHTPASCAGWICVTAGLKTVQVIEAGSGSKLWQLEAGQAFTSPPACDEGLLYIGIKDPHRPPRLGAYSLAQRVWLWSYPAEGLVQVRPLAGSQVIYCADESGVLHAVNQVNGLGLWKHPSPDRIRSQLVICDDMLLFGTQTGGVVGLSSEPHAHDMWDLPPLECLVENGDLKAAAVRCALDGDLGQSARYYQQAGSQREAAILFRETGELELALTSALETGLVELVESVLQRAPTRKELVDRHHEALVQLYKRTDLHRSMAKTMEDLGRHQEAGELWSAAGEHYRAATAFLKAGNTPAAVEAAGMVQNPAEQVKILLRTGEQEQAAQILERHGKLQEAQQLYLKAGRPLEALRLSEALEDWQGAVQIAEQMDLPERAANSYRHLGKLQQAFLSYRQAAMQVESQLQPGELSERAASLYEMALECLPERDRNRADEQSLLAKIDRHRLAPRLRLSFAPPADPFILDELASVELELANIGWGRARELDINVDTDFQNRKVDPIHSLEIGDKEKVALSLRPVNPDLVGQDVPITTWVGYKDPQGRAQSLPFTIRAPIGRDIAHAAHLRQGMPNRDQSGSRIYYVMGGQAIFGNVDNRQDYVEMHRLMTPANPDRTRLRFCPFCAFPLANFLNEDHCPRCQREMYAADV